MITKYVNFDYFYVVCKPKGAPATQPDGPFDLTTVFSILSPQDLLERTREYKQEKARLEEISLVGDYDYLWSLYFTRLRDFNLPSKAKENAPAQPFDLEDDEFIGENVSAIYDETHHILMLQRNKYSLGPAAVEDYLNNFVNQEEEVFLRPIPVKNSRRRIREAEYIRKLRIKFADVKDAEEKVKGASLKGWLKTFNDYDSVTGEILITAGRKKKASLGGNLTGLIEEVYNNEDLITKAEVSVKKTDLADTEIIDLFETNAHDITTFSVPTRTILHHETVVLRMQELYEKKRSELVEILYK